MSAADIAAARARVEMAQEKAWLGRHAFGEADNVVDAYVDAVSDLLLAMTAPEPAPAEPALPAAVVPWVTALREVWPECVVKPDESRRPWHDVWETEQDHRRERRPGVCVHSDGERGFIVLRDGFADCGDYPTPADLVAALRKALGQEGSAKEPGARTVEEDVAREVKPERVAVLRHRDGWCVYSDGSCDSPIDPDPAGFWDIAPIKAGERRAWIQVPCRLDTPVYTALIDWPPAPTPAPESADDKATRIGRELDPSPVVAALEPEPAGPPSLWEWVRAADGTKLGPGRWHTPDYDHIQCQWRIGSRYVRAVFPLPLINDRLPSAVAYVQTGDSRGFGKRSEDVFCTTPAELTAALDALAEEVGRG